MRTQLQPNSLPGRRGSVLVTAIILTVLLGTVALTFLSVSARQQKEGNSSDGTLNSFYAADAGLSAAYVELQNGGDGALGSADAPQSLGGLSFWVESNAIDDDVTSLVATGTDGRTTSRIEMVVEDQSSDITDFGVFGERLVDLKSNSKIDSYDSSLGTYASQVSGAFAKSNGNVGTNDDIVVAANAKVYGYAQYGPSSDDTISIASNVTLNDGYGAAKAEITLAPVVVPSYANQAAVTVNANQTKTLGPGNLQVPSITTKSNSNLKVVGPCNLVITDAATINSNSTWTFDATNGPINVYAKKDFELKSNSTIATTVKDPTKLTFYLSGVHASKSASSPKVDFSSNSQFYGTVYAPDLAVSISSNFELYGSLKAQWITLASNSKIHYDQKLAVGPLDASTGYEVLAWRPLTGELAPTE
jgi:hypothetical protein